MPFGVFQVLPPRRTACSISPALTKTSRIARRYACRIRDSMNRQQARQLMYVLITPARDEAALIEGTIQSVVRQKVLPAKWVIVSDGSADGTDDIVIEYAEKHDWIDLVRMPRRKERDFAGKANALKAGYERLKGLPFEIIGSLDADITFEEDYISFLLSKFAMNPKLGLAGTPFIEGGESYDFRFSAIEHVSGACQLFRRECYEGIGGYVPVKGGGIDLIAVLTARMQGWETRTFTEMYSLHHRKRGATIGSAIKTRFRDGQKDYVLGAHPVWEVFRTLYQMSQKPFLIRGLAILCGYAWNGVRDVDKSLPAELVRFRRNDQMRRLREFFTRLLRPRRGNHL
jgi:biofilm PGA synthesis N-glycosyltransferase PgaC